MQRDPGSTARLPSLYLQSDFVDTRRELVSHEARIARTIFPLIEK
jgi:hypothetical protein